MYSFSVFVHMYQVVEHTLFIQGIKWGPRHETFLQRLGSVGQSWVSPLPGSNSSALQMKSVRLWPISLVEITEKVSPESMTPEIVWLCEGRIPTWVLF
jgi:hypothetical protein